MSRIDDIERALNKSPNEKKDNNFLLYFLLGIVLLGAGIFMVSKNTYIVASMYVWHIGGMNISSGLVAIPLFLGIGMLFYNAKSFLGWIILILGGIWLILSIIMSVHIRFRTTDLFTYILMFGSIFAGAGFLLRAIIKGNK